MVIDPIGLAGIIKTIEGKDYVYKPLLSNPKPKKVKNKRRREVLKNALVPNENNLFRFEMSLNFCRHCSGRLYWQIRKKVGEKQFKKAYYYMKWERCWDCNAFYMDDSSKVMNAPKSKKIKEKKGQKPLSAKEYVAYINSVQWFKRRRRYFATHSNICVICGSKERLNLHHKTYARLGCELDTDLVPLCGEHHDEFHRLHGKTVENMVDATETFIESKRREIDFAEMAKSF